MPLSEFGAHEDGSQKLVLLQTFNERGHQRFQARGSGAFRGTLMLAALSYMGMRPEAVSHISLVSTGVGRSAWLTRTLGVHFSLKVSAARARAGALKS